MVGKLMHGNHARAGTVVKTPYDRSCRKSTAAQHPLKTLKSSASHHGFLELLDDDIQLYDSSDVESIAASSDSLFMDSGDLCDLSSLSNFPLNHQPSDQLFQCLNEDVPCPSSSYAPSEPTCFSLDPLPDLEFLASDSDIGSTTPVDFSDTDSEIDNGYLDGIPLAPAVVFPPIDNSSYLETTVAPAAIVPNLVAKDSMYTSSKHKPPMWSTHIPKVREAPPRLVAPMTEDPSDMKSSCCDLASPLGVEADATLFDFQPHTFGDPCNHMNKRCRPYNATTYKPFNTEHNVPVWAHAQQEHKRAVLNVLERARREDLKSSFHRLRDEIPELRGDKRVPKGQILKRASEFIKALEKEGQEYEQQIQFLREKNQRLLGEAPINSLLGTR